MRQRLPNARTGAIFLAAALFVQAAQVAQVARGQEADEAGQLVDCGTDKVVTFPKTMSRDGRFAAGWTIRPARKSVKPVDWSQWSDRNLGPFLERYPWDRAEFDKPPYVMVEGAVDLKRRLFVETGEGWMVPPNAVWSDAEAEGRRYGVLGKTRRRGARMLLLVVADKEGLRTVDLLDGAQKAVTDFLIREARGLKFTGVFFTPQGFAGNVARVGFSAEDFYNYDQDIDGTLTIRLPEGTVQEVKRKTERDPFTDNPELAKAEARLQEVYVKLLGQLNAPGRTALEKEQTAWAAKRDRDANDEVVKPGGKGGYAQAVYEKALLDATLARISELLKRTAVGK